MKIDIQPIGNLGNRMIQYLAAKKLQEFFPQSEIPRSNLPEFGYKEEDSGEERAGSCLTIELNTGMPLRTAVETIWAEKPDVVFIHDHMQRMDWLPDRLGCMTLFPFSGDYLQIESGQLLINIRAAEIVAGIGHYPLVPVDFYEKIVSRTGLTPVFMGQIGDNAYCRSLRQRFPAARFILSQGALSDFQTILSATNIVISVSTFSWLAAWLSNAAQIFVPMLGFLSPMHFPNRIIDLLPTEDPRFRFFLFPLHFGVPELQDLPYHHELTKHCREISPRQVDFLRRQAPILEVAPFAGDFDGHWYCHNYLDAALEIAEGWCAGPAEHFAEIGRRRGHDPLPNGFSLIEPGPANEIVDHAVGKKANQSSISEWSVGRTTAEDAERAVNGLLHDPYGFHSEWENDPWWEVDLNDVCEVDYIVILNRCDTELIAARATPLAAYVTADDSTWNLLFVTPDGFIFGRDGRTLTWRGPSAIKVRRVRLTVNRFTCLHLRQVKICGSKLNSDPG